MDLRSIYRLSFATIFNDANRNYYDVVAFTHLDDDHICGSFSFFYLEHASKYRGALIA
jgi:hypothetical protein